MEEEEAWVEKASQLLPFLAGFLAILKDYAGVSRSEERRVGKECA